MKNMNITITDEMKSLKGKEYVFYCRYEHPSKDFRKEVAMLLYAVSEDMEKAEEYIKRLIEEKDKSFIAYYPSIDDDNKIKGKERIGTILDGCLYFG